MKRDSRIPVSDGIDIGISIFDAGNPRGVLVFNPAMGVPRSFYDDFANWMSTQGYRVITWNYRGTAGSGDPRNSDAHIHEWGEEDLDTLLGWCREQWPDLPLVIGAHSVGGQIIGMANNARQWARWGRDPDYLQGHHRRDSADGYAAITCPLLGVWIGDDALATWAANRAMLGWYRRADITMLDLVPAQQGMQRIGHFGFFRAEHGRDRLWPQLTRWLDKVLPGLPSTSDKEARHVPADIRD